ncbi:MAG TPA: membrane dipeptidase [Phycisphaerales bacterium]|nr:membrane dipeptidase [Phycisphaerales bacterium]
MHPFIDGHLDLACMQLVDHDILTPVDRAKFSISLPDLREGSVNIAFATIFTEPGEAAASKPIGYASSDHLDQAEAAGLRQLHLYQSLESQNLIRIIRSRADLTHPLDLQKQSAPLNVVILMEGADPIRSPEHARIWFDLGVRIVGLSWAMGTRYAGGNGPMPKSSGADPAIIARQSAARTGPLSPLGREIVKTFDALGIIHDASHLSDAAFDELLSLSTGPVIASHSNARALMNDWQRHISDRHIRAIASRNGIIGLNLFSMFLAIDRRATIADCVNHLNHITSIMGHRRGIALGSDMDGGFGSDQLPENLTHPSLFPKLLEALSNSGWSDADLRAFAYQNWFDFLSRTLPV